MQNVELIKGQCALCRGPIDKKWAGESPSLGIKCRECYSKRKVFGPDNVEINVKKQVIFNPLFGRYEYHFNWEGSKIMVNGKVGVIVRPQGDGDFVKFEDDKTSGLGTFINGVGYWDLLRIYKEHGGDITPPPLVFSDYVPEKTQLLDEPIMPINIEIDEKRKTIRAISVGERRGGSVSFGAGPEPPILSTFHAFANLYVRYKFGLVPNYVCEGGFIGRNFEVRNAMFGPVSIRVTSMGSFGESSDQVRSIKDFHRYDTVQRLLSAIYLSEQERLLLVLPDADFNTVLSTWALVMTTLLRYDWRKERYETIEDIWRCYCRMQDVLLNIMPTEELKSALDYARKNEMKHAGNSF